MFQDMKSRLWLLKSYLMESLDMSNTDAFLGAIVAGMYYMQVRKQAQQLQQWQVSKGHCVDVLFYGWMN